MQIEENEIHVWTADLSTNLIQELLSSDEKKRANRFLFPIHKQRFIAARSILRKILSFYLAVPPQEIMFTYNSNGKPFLHMPSTHLQFNLSHSENIAIYAITMTHDIGIDIEKIQETYNRDLAKRFFSLKENQDLLLLPLEEQKIAFYRIWSRKEAIIKAIGKGLTIPLSTFSVSVHDVNEVISLDQNENWSLIPLSILTDFQSVVATNQYVKKISYWTFFEQSPKLNKVHNL
ncbi:MAG: 4'-phosphopantetheinyl transferase superfamily protein [Gammaproteobacteria bacterium]|nr:4'-phosphopantetheinyl transferase superfamily protein [Gammaproteobacteria bacterium]MCW5583042.1 4'-phosphopantetheinyl transferase superfamily protein [Gammaproteobacteria bacterium]